MQDDSRAGNIIPPPPLAGADYDAIFATMAATERGRWFLDEYAVRHRGADTDLVLAALGRIEAEMRAGAARGGRAHEASPSPQDHASPQDRTSPLDGATQQAGGAPLPDSVRQDLAAASAAVSRARQAVGYAEAEHAAALRGLIDEIDWRLQSLAEALLPDRASADSEAGATAANDFDDLSLTMAGTQPKSTAAIEVAVADWGFAASEQPREPEPTMPSRLSARLPPLDLDLPAGAHSTLAAAAAWTEEAPPPPARPAFDWAVASSAAPEPAVDEASPVRPVIQERLIDERYIETPAAAIARLEAREYARHPGDPQDYRRENHQQEELSQRSPLQDPLPQDRLLQDGLLQGSLLQNSLLQEPLLRDSLAQDSLVQDSVLQDSLLQDSLSQEGQQQDELLQPSLDVEPYSVPEPAGELYSARELGLPSIDDVVDQPERLDLSPIRAALDELVMEESVAAAMHDSEPEPAFRSAFKPEARPFAAEMPPSRTSSAADLMDMVAAVPPASATDVAADPLFDSELFDAEHTRAQPEGADLPAPAQSLSGLIDAAPTGPATLSTSDVLGDLTEHVVHREVDAGDTAPTLTQPQAPRFATSPPPATSASPRVAEPAADGDKAQVLDRLEHMRRSIASLMDEIAQKTGRPIERPRP